VTTHLARALAIAVYRPGDAAGGDAALARIAGSDGARARAVLAELHAADGAGLVARIRRELAETRPAHWQSVHATWLDELVAGESAAARAAVLGDGESPHERHLARAFLGGVWPMPDPTTIPPNGVASLLGLEPERLARTIVLLGRRQLAYALVGTPREELTALASRISWGKELFAEVTALGQTRAAADAHLGRQTSALARLRDIHVADARGPARIGMRALAPSVARVPDLAEQLVQRLSRPLALLARVDLRMVDPPDGVSDAEIAQAIARASVAEKL
jgi:hypothetical protein